MLDFLSGVLVALLQAVVVAFCGAVVVNTELPAILPACGLGIVECIFGVVCAYYLPTRRILFAV